MIFLTNSKVTDLILGGKFGTSFTRFQSDYVMRGSRSYVELKRRIEDAVRRYVHSIKSVVQKKSTTQNCKIGPMHVDLSFKSSFEQQQEEEGLVICIGTMVTLTTIQNNKMCHFDFRYYGYWWWNRGFEDVSVVDIQRLNETLETLKVCFLIQGN